MAKKKVKPAYRVEFMGCAHIPYHNEEALWVALDYALSKNPDEVIFTELFDFYKVGWWRKDPQRMSFTAEVEIDQQMVAKLTKEIKKAKSVEKVTYIKGNHDVRLDSYLMDHAPELYGWDELTVPEKMNFSKHNWNWVDNAELLLAGGAPYNVGKLYFLHGHEVKVAWRAINPAKLYYEKCRTNIIAAHLHKTSEWIVRTIAQQHTGGWCIGCLCNLSSEFSLHNSWIHGLADIVYDADGLFSVNNKKIIKGRVV
jgi:hypothetical protein